MCPKFVSEDTFNKEVLRSNIPVLVDFYASWCSPCKHLAPILEEVEVEFEKKIRVVKVDVNENATLAEAYNVQGIPNLILFKGGKIVDNKVGSMTKESLYFWIESFL